MDVHAGRILHEDDSSDGKLFLWAQDRQSHQKVGERHEKILSHRT
jgi:hypothetical protein